MEKPEALRLADAIDPFVRPYAPDHLTSKVSAAELRRQHGEIKSMRAERLRSERRLLDVKAQRDALLEALKGITPSMPPADAPCHYGIVPQENCGHCGRIAKARAAIKAVEEGK